MDIVGQKYGSLLVVKRSNIKDQKTRESFWECVCDCGNTVNKTRTYLKRHNHPSCGCLDNITKKPGYYSWRTMIMRCYNHNDQAYSYYGGRGICVCERWKESFLNFLEDMGERPEGKTLDRIDVNGNYCPDNCRWATISEQSYNKRNTIHIEYGGEQLTLEELSKKIGINRKTIYARLHIYGWSAERAIYEKPKGKKKL